jgi:hypothetical protein
MNKLIIYDVFAATDIIQSYRAISHVSLQKPPTFHSPDDGDSDDA